MSDLAVLGLRIDSTQVEAGVASLDKLTAAGTRAEKSTDELGKASAETAAKTKTASQAAAEMAASAQAAAQGGTAYARAYAAADIAIVNLANAQAAASREVAQAKAAYNAGTLSLEQYNAELLRTKAALGLVEAQHAGAMASLRRTAAANDDVGKSTNAYAFAARNLNFQLVDMAQGLAMGMPPLMIMMQQVPQAASAFGDLARESGGAGSAVAGLAARFGPAIIAAGALAAAMALLTHEINQNAKVHVTWKDVALGTYDAVIAKVKGELTDAFAEFGITTDEVFKGTVSVAKWAANGMIASIAVVPRVVTTAFQVIPGAIADVFVSGANMAIRAMNGLIKAAVELINDYINKANGLISAVAKFVPGMGNFKIPTISAPQIGELRNNFAGAGRAAADAMIGAVKDTFARDYVGEIADYINPFAQARARERMEKDAKDTGGKAGRALGKAASDGADDELAKLTESIQRTADKVLGELGVAFNKAMNEMWEKDWEAMIEGIRAPAREAIEQLENFEEALNDLKGTFDDLNFGDYFGSFGEGIDGMAAALAGLTKAQQDYGAAQHAANQAKTAPERDAQLAKASAAYTEQQLRGTLGLISASKKLFSEKSAAYKAMEAIEKAYAAFQLVNTAISVAQGAAKIFGQGGIAGFVLVPVMLAIMAGLGFKGGGGSMKAPPTAQLLQEQAGTGSVLGDPTAKSNSIANSLELMAANSNRELEYSNDMLRALRSIDTSIAKMAGTIAKQISVAGGMFDLSRQRIGSSGSSGFLGLFASKTTRELWDVGMDLDADTVSKILTDGIDGRTYQIIQQIKEKSGFLGIGGGTSTTYEESHFRIEQDILDAVHDVIRSLRNGLIEASKVVGIEGADAIIDNFRIEIGRLSFKDMSGEEIEKQLNAVFSKVGDSMAGAILPALKDMQQIGEGLFETFMRVVRQYQVVDTSLRSIGLTFGATGVASLAARDALVQLFGSLDEFVSQTEYYRQNFLTEAERIAPVFASVNAELARLGLTGVDTIAKFKGIIDGLDLTTTAGQQTYAALMALAPAFATVEKFQEKEAKAYTDKADSLRAYLRELTGGTAAGFATIAARFRNTAAAAAGGDMAALDGLKGASQDYLSAVKDRAGSLLEYQRARAQVLNSVTAGISAADREAQARRTMLAVESVATEVVALRSDQNRLQLQVVENTAATTRLLARMADSDTIRVSNDNDTPLTVDFTA